ncbi:MAG: hypothetical protein JW951_00040, partial [Lentisphaerae bacterium]|nr:hypothetical protein [Lentisphaerota bacterium]
MTWNSRTATGGEADRGERRRGIALVICLGMLSVMMVLAVSFAISMRTERVAAGNAVEIMKARQLVYGALSRALWDIERDMARNSMVGYPAHWGVETAAADFKNAVTFNTGEAALLMPRGVLRSSGKLASRGTNMAAAGNTIFDGNADWEETRLKYALDPWSTIVEGLSPGGGYQQGYIDRYDTGNASGNTHDELWAKNTGGSRMNWGKDWYRIVEPALPQWWPVTNVGRYAYLVVNVSGLLDANRAGHASPSATMRPTGHDAEDIDLSRLTEFRPGVPAGEGAEVTAFVNNRTTYPYPYASLAELKSQNAVFDNESPRHFFTYTRAEGRQGAATVPVFIGGDENDLDGTKEQEIKSALGAMGIPSTQERDVLYRNLIDYVDADDVPYSLTGPYVEAVPMLNEVFATNTLTVNAAGGVNGQLRVFFEYWYPFGEEGEDFTLYSSVSTPTNLPGGLTVIPAPQPPPTRDFAPGEFFYVIQRFRMMGGTNALSGGLNYNLGLEARVASGGDTVDVMPPLSLNIKVPEPAAFPATVSGGGGHDVVDPRMNWHERQWANIAPFEYHTTIEGVNGKTVNS